MIAFLPLRCYYGPRDHSHEHKVATLPNFFSMAQQQVRYQSGFSSYFETEAIPGSLPVARNNPQKCPFGLYAEQLSGTAFTLPRHENQRTWFYRIRPSVCHGPFVPYHGVANVPSSLQPAAANQKTASCTSNPNQLRWSPFASPSKEKEIDFVDSLTTITGNGDPSSRSGLAIHIYSCNASMKNKAFYNSDGDFLFVLQHGSLVVRTEVNFMNYLKSCTDGHLEGQTRRNIRYSARNQIFC